MWCAHTTNPNAPIAMIAHTIGRYPNTGLREKVAITWLIKPKPGRIMM